MFRSAMSKADAMKTHAFRPRIGAKLAGDEETHDSKECCCIVAALAVCAQGE
jgi:hypothetical protein